MSQPVVEEKPTSWSSRSISYFDSVYQAYQQAEAICEKVSLRYFRIANSVVCLRFAGEALVPLLVRALAHLEVPAVSQPDLTICLVSTQDVGVARPAPAWQGNRYQRRGEVFGFTNDRIYTGIQWESGALVLLDQERNLAIYWVHEHSKIPHWEIGAPCLPILNAWFSQRQAQVVHSAAIGTVNSAVLLVGKGGSGKSTTALSCLNSSLMYLSDDYCLIAPEPAPTVFSIYSTGKKNTDDLDRLPFLRSLVSNPDRLNHEKAIFFLHENFSEKILPSSLLKATFIPRVTGKIETTLEKATSVEGISALIPSTIKQIGGAGKTACDLIMKTLSQLPCYYLNLGTDIPQIAQTIQRFLDSE